MDLTGMTALPHDTEADLRRRILELEQRLQSTVAQRDEAIERQTAAALVNFRLQNELRATLDRQKAGAEILRTIAAAPTDAEQSLQQIAETTARFFSASSVTIRITDGNRWTRTIAVGRAAERIVAAVPTDQLTIDGKNLPGMVYRENRQIHIPDLDNVDPSIADFPGLAPARAGGTRTMSGTPLRRGHGAIGALIIHRDRLAPFTPDELALQQNFADQAVIAIENARLFNETQEALERQTATSDILKVIASSPADVQPVFEAIAKSARRVVGGHSCGVTRVVGDNLHLAAFTTTSEAGRETLARSFPIPLSSPRTLAQVARTGQVMMLADMERDADDTSKQIARARGYRSMLVVPMLRDSAAIGTIAVTREEPGGFDGNAIGLLKTFADQAVIAIENARLFNEVQAKTRGLTEALTYQTGSANILKVIASSPTDVEPVLTAIVESACVICEAENAHVTLKDGDELVFQAQHGSAPVVWKRQPINRRWVTGRAAVDRRPIHVHDLLSSEGDEFPDGRELARRDGARTMLAVPLLREGECVGVIVLRRMEVRPFSEKQIELLQTFADQAVIAIENTRLFNETREALERQTATADILKVIASSPSDAQPVFEAIANSANRLLGGFSSTVFLFIDGMAHLGAFTPTTAEADEVLRSTFPRPVAEFAPIKMTQAGEVTQVPDTEDLTDDIKNIARARGYRSMLFAPLMNKGVSIGFVAVTRVQPGPFVDHHAQLLQTFADQAVIAIENVRLFDEVQAKTRDLEEALRYQTGSANILRVIASSPTDVKPVLKAIVESACELCGAYDALVRLKDGDGLAFGAHHGPIPVSLASVPITENSTAGLAVIGREPVHVHDLLSTDGDRFPHAQELASMHGERTILSVPLLREDESIGAIVLRRTEMQPFSSKQISLLQTFADQAVIAIGNVRLFEQVQARTRELTQSLDDLRAAQGRLIQTEKLASLGQLTAGIAHEIKNPLNFVNNFSALSVELTDELKDVLKQATLADKIRTDVEELTGLLKDNLGKVVQHGKRADSIVKSMLLHSREGSGEHRPADVNALVDESLNLAYHGARAEKPQFNVTLMRNFDPEAGMIEVFPQEITRVLLNLISNGFYAVTKRKAENGSADFEPLVTATTKGRTDRVEICIRDNGTGIPLDVKEKMFNPFFTTKPAGEGTGLGLSMSHDIVVKQHGGTIEVTTEPGEFTEFTIVLPRTSAAVRKSASPSASS
jgi:two-component system, NtrC family, sensor kinase